jgi:hypothetical protein
MKKRLKNPPNPVFKPQDRYYVNAQDEWRFFTVDKISGPYSNKSECVDACRYYIQKRDGVL